MTIAVVAEIPDPPACPTCGTHLRTRVGTDVQEVAPVRESLSGARRTAYVTRLFTPGELADCGVNDGTPAERVAESLAARFAAKEAVVKILQEDTSATARRAPWTDIEIRRIGGGQPTVNLRGFAARQARTGRLESWSCSLSHDGGWAVATVIALQKVI